MNRSKRAGRNRVVTASGETLAGWTEERQTHHLGRY
jgi:hypothetical protein